MKNPVTHGIFYGSPMYTLHCTKKLLDRIKPRIAPSVPEPTTALGNWYATALFWKPQVALVVNERTLLPVLMPLAPAASIGTRFPSHLAAVLAAHDIDPAFIAHEVAEMAEVGFAKTANRSVVGSMNDFSWMVEGYREGIEGADLLTLSMRLAEVPCGPIKSSPDRFLKQFVEHWNA
jgi:hypothetical protein